MQQAGWARRYFRALSVGAISISTGPTVPTISLSYIRDGRRQGRGCPGPRASLRSGSLTCGNAPQKLLILVVIYPVEACRQGVRWGPLVGLGPMFSSIQAINMAGLCRSGQTVVPRPPYSCLHPLLDESFIRECPAALKRGR